MRLECTTPGVDDCWVDVVESWSQRQIDSVGDTDAEQYAELLRTKLTGCHLLMADGEYIDNPAGINTESMNDLDIRQSRFIAHVFFAAFKRLRELGNASVPELYGVSAANVAE